MKVAELTEIVGGRLVGHPETEIKRIADLDQAGDAEIAYVDNERFFAAARASLASCLIVPAGAAEKFPERTVIEVANPKLAFSLIAAALHPPIQRGPEIHASAVIAESADVALTAYVGPHVQIGEYTLSLHDALPI